jgi:hypothetical protein
MQWLWEEDRVMSWETIVNTKLCGKFNVFDDSFLSSSALGVVYTKATINDTRASHMSDRVLESKF